MKKHIRIFVAFDKDVEEDVVIEELRTRSQRKKIPSRCTRTMPRKTLRTVIVPDSNAL